MSADTITYVLDGDVAVIRLDDGKANALSPSLIEALGSCLDRAEAEAKAVVMTGRPGRFSAGFDLTVMQTGPQELRSLVEAGAELMLRLYEYPRPVVAACSGHALAAGAILLLVCDVRVGSAGEFKIGLNEVAIGMPLPAFGVEFARARIGPRYLTEATTLARIYGPDTAVEVGYLDQVVAPDELMDAAMNSARSLAALTDPAYRGTKRRLRGAAAKHVRDVLAVDLDQLD